MRSRKRTPASRSEQLRQEREKASQKKLSSISSRTPMKRYRNSVPIARPTKNYAVSGGIVSRGGIANRGTLTSTPVLNRTRTTVRKIFSIPLNSPGAELRLPPIPIIKPGWRLLSGFLVIALGLILYMFAANPIFKVSHITFKGVQRLNTADFETALGITDKPIYTINTQQIKEKLSVSYPELYNTSVKISLPAIVTISTVERVPIIAWQYNNVTLWIDSDGNIFPARGDPGSDLLTIQSDEAPPLPPLSAQTKESNSNQPTDSTSKVMPGSLVTQYRTDPALLRAAMDLIQKLPKKTTLIYSSVEGLGWTDKRGWNVFIGSDVEDIELKMTMYDAILKVLNKQGVRPRMISLKYLNAPFFRVE